MDLSVNPLAVDQTAETRPYFFVVQYIQGELTDWKKFKDFIKPLFKTDERPGWVSLSRNLLGNYFRASFGVKKPQDATSIFQYLVRSIQGDGTPFHVHWFDSCTVGFKHHACNCLDLGLAVYVPCAYYRPFNLYSYQVPGSTQAYQDPELTAIPLAAVTRSQAGNGLQALTSGISSLRLSGSSNARSADPQPQPTAGGHIPAPDPTAFMSPLFDARRRDGLPVNVSKSVIRTGSRGVHAGNLNYKAIPPNNGWAIVPFRTSKKANEVIKSSGGSNVDGKRFCVREDKKRTSVEVNPQPTIVNGSTGYAVAGR